MYRDTRLAELLQSLPPLPFSKALHPPATSRNLARRAFLATGELPTFTYPWAEQFDGEAYRSQLQQTREAISQDSSSDHIKKLYLDKLTELETRSLIITAVATRDDQRVSDLSQRLYGKPSHDLESFEQEFRARLELVKQGKLHHHTKSLDAQAFADLAKQALTMYGLTNVEVGFTSKKRIRCSHHRKGATMVLRIPKTLRVSKQRARRLIAHEIEVHALRRLNGQQSSFAILERGLANYQTTEEGLALYYQHLGKQPKFAPGFWDAWTSSLMLRLGFTATFQRLTQAMTDLQTHDRDDRKANNKAWRLCLRASRGISKPGPAGIGYFKDQIYRRGYLEIKQRCELQGEAQTFQQLFVGKVATEQLEELTTLQLSAPQLPRNVAQQLLPKTKHRH